MKQRKSKSGFTLVELMLVAVIVAILAAAAIPLMSGNKKRAMATEAEAALGTIRSSLRAMYADTGSYALDPNGTAIAAGASVASVPGISVADLNGRYFGGAQYTVSAIGASTYTLSVTGTGDVAGVTITLNQDGQFTRTGL